MTKKGMIKKHLITCSVIFVLVVISRFTICSKEVSKTAAVAYHPIKFIFVQPDAASDFSFANEALPLNDERVNRKMQHSLSQHDYKKVQSNLLQQKAEKLFPIIEPILKLYGIPDDFKYIPLVESGLCAGVSSKGAAGLWQFMPGTARTYGLKVSHGIDERLNVKKSTVAACKYIKELYGEFNSWTLAAAAYNNGEIKLQKAINHQNEDNYFRMHLNRETGVYVYNLIAMKEIISQPAKYGYKRLYTAMPLSTQQLLAYN
jgi:membrane-bound lytic murein transglycosylase D